MNRVMLTDEMAVEVGPCSVSADRDAKLSELKALIIRKVQAPIKGENRKILLFTDFADTADYLYRELGAWAYPRGR